MNYRMVTWYLPRALARRLEDAHEVMRQVLLEQVIGNTLIDTSEQAFGIWLLTVALDALEGQQTAENTVQI